jgi:TonB family protein
LEILTGKGGSSGGRSRSSRLIHLLADYPRLDARYIQGSMGKADCRQPHRSVAASHSGSAHDQPKAREARNQLAPQITDFHLDVPAEPVPSGRPDTPIVGSPGLPGPINQVGSPLTLNVVHYVAPIYPPQAVRAREHGSIAMALLVNAQGDVEQIKILRSTGSSRLDKAAVSAVRQWKFAAATSVARNEPVWGQVSLRFVPPQYRLRVPVIVMPYAAIARKIDAEIATNRARHPHSPSSEVSVRSLLQELIAAFPSERAQEPGTTQESAGDSVEAELGLLGPIQSLTFLGFVDHGIDRDQSNSSDFRDPPRLERTHWEVYDVKQDHGSSVWVVAATARGSIQRIEVAIR